MNQNNTSSKLRGFTLIELLVVIAIIAILAAILFPVFAQAKAAAKKTASLSNSKQIATATLSYSAGNNDGLPPADSWGGRSLYAGLNFGGVKYKNWGELTLPYVKTRQMYLDPLGPGEFAMPAGWEAYADNLVCENASWGYNYSWLSPVISPYNIQVKSTGSLGNPAGTVMFASSFAQQEGGFTPTGVSWWGAGTAVVGKAKVEAPDCYTAPGYCLDNWGKGGSWDTQLKGVYEAGARTGGMSIRANGGSIVVFTDGHAARMTTGALAAGTNWTKDTDASAVVTNDVSKYLWDDK